MDNQTTGHRVAKRRRVNSSTTDQNQLSPYKMIIILDDTWLEALKHLTYHQWSQMSQVCHQIKGIIQRNLSRLPRQVIERIAIHSQYLSFNPRFASVASSLQKLFHPASYIKIVTMPIVSQKLIDANSNGEERFIRCQKFALLPFSDILITPQKISQSLEWLVRNVRSDSISLPERMFNRIHNTVKIRAMLTNFIFESAQECKAQELVFCFDDYLSESCLNGFSGVMLVDILIEDFLALPVVQGTIPTVVIDRYPTDEQYHKHLGENLIGREVDSQGAEFLYEIENGEKRVRISLCRSDTYPFWYGRHRAILKFYLI
ncbi:hypothetical protein DdX_17872 [Ditylenchus destructor]|uniref:F-box domain-containing protein n=1 Tax=Ditylenchus destructor TaxID=166010 RepID=A0AAD4QT61_9BILA|nr:hypothetical protein DdX_17872 [Ditylenchus destructor]